MPFSSNDTQYQVLGPSGAVYPGHPLTLAHLIVLSFPSLGAALHKEPDATYGVALSSGAIPGAGSNVHAALDLMRYACSLGLEAAIAWGDEYWASCTSGANFGERTAPGQAQADILKPAFREAFYKWNLTS